MKYISELPKPYKSLAEKRREQQYEKSDRIERAFAWVRTPEDLDFWNNVFRAKTEQELPPIPEAE